MAYDSLKFRIVFMLLLSDACGYTFGDFPLSDCDTGRFDILVMTTTKSGYEFSNKYRLYWPELIMNCWTQYGNIDSRVLVSKVEDIWNSYSDNNECRLILTKHDGEQIDMCDNMTVTLPNNFNNRNVQLHIQTKINISEDIFANFGVGRVNTTHVAIILVDASHFAALTVDAIRRIPHILQNKHSEIKVAVLVQDFNTRTLPTFLPDTLIASSDMWYEEHILSMSLCNRCLSDWFPFQRKVVFSCYKLEFDSVKTDYDEAVLNCELQGGHLAAVESSDELAFLQATLFFNLLLNIKSSNELHNYSAKVYIGLKRDSLNAARRFQWAFSEPKQNRPLVINHWLPGDPKGGFTNACGVWSYDDIFKYKNITDETFNNASEEWSVLLDYISSQSEGWSSVACGLKLSKASLCEITLSRYLEDPAIVRKEPANNESFYTASSRSDFRVFDDMIVSVSAYANNERFLNFLKDKNEDFPMFDCGDDATSPRYISYSFVCDFIGHCINGNDERVCFTDESCNYHHTSCDGFKDCEDGRDEENCKLCSSRRCCDGTCFPVHLFNDGEIDCIECKTNDNIVINDESSFSEESLQINETCAFICNRHQCVYPFQLNDGITDCRGLEGPLDETIGKLERAESCSDKLGRPFWAPRCVYIRDRYGSVLGCRDLSHLQNCSDFHCQEGYYKCPGSYCIPLHYVQDEKNDCPSGEEEELVMSSTCVGNFACWKSKVCLHPDLVCDGCTDCPYKDDELNCHTFCAKGFRCVAGTVTVEKNKTSTQIDGIIFYDERARYVDLSDVDLSHGQLNIYAYRNLHYLRASRCKLTDIYPLFAIFFLFSNATIKLDLSYNLITSFTDGSYSYVGFKSLRTLNLSFNEHLDDFANQKLKWLENLDLSHTSLSHLSQRSLVVLPKLKYLNLSFTRISNFQRDIIPPGFTFAILDLRGAPIVKFDDNTFNDLRITTSLYATTFALCCPQIRGKNILGDMCHAPDKAISSCFDLIEVHVQRILLWLMAGIALFGNLIVILFRLILDRAVLKKAYGLFVLNLGISDLIMGLYLLVIATTDVYYRGVYVLYDKDWRESVVCKGASFLATLSSETSTFFIFLITVDRYLALKFPYGQNQFSTLTKSVALSLAWGIGLLLALIPVLSIFGPDSVFSSTAMCNGLPLTNQQVNDWGYSFSVFIVLNFVMFLAIARGQIAIFQSISANRISLDLKNQNSVRRAQDITVAKQLSLVAVSNFLCWFPVGLMGFLSLSGLEISNDVYAWTVVLVLPVNSAINPVLYTIPVLLARWKKYKYGKS